MPYAKAPSPIAVIDDNAALAASIALVLKCEGFEVDLFGSAEVFLADCAVSRYGCLLIDWMLPGMNGIALCRRLAATPCPPPMILMSGQRIDIESLRSELDKDIRFIEKPFDPEWLLAEMVQLTQFRA